MLRRAFRGSALKTRAVISLFAGGLTGCGLFSSAPPSGVELHSINAAGHTWTYAIHAPDTPTVIARPLVIVLHGTGGNGPDALFDDHWIAKSDEANFIAVAPTALPDRPDDPPSFLGNPTFWNAGPWWRDSPRQQIDDLAFFRALLAELQQSYAIDPARIFIAGHSSGGAMAFRLASEMTEQFAAIAIVSSPCWEQAPHPAFSIPTLLFAGTADPLVPFLGGEVSTPWGTRFSPPIADTIARWSEALGCNSTPASQQTIDAVTTLQFAPQNAAPIFTVVEITGQGHGWPGGISNGLAALGEGPSISALDATATAWQFFADHPRP